MKHPIDLQHPFVCHNDEKLCEHALSDDIYEGRCAQNKDAHPTTQELIVYRIETLQKDVARGNNADTYINVDIYQRLADILALANNTEQHA